MSDQDPRWQQLRAAFAAELEERVRALNDLLLKLERGLDDGAAGPPKPEILDGLFREAHNLKGASRAVGLADVERLAHGIESVLESARESGAEPTRAWFDAVYRAVDSLERAGGDDGDSVDVDRVLADLEGTGPHPPTPVGISGPHPPTPSPTSGRGGADPSRGEPVARPTEGEGREAPAPAPVPAANGHREEQHYEAARTSTESVRVAVGKLDTLLAQTGELAITHTRIEQRLKEIRELREDLDAWRREWRNYRGLRPDLRHLVANTDDTLSRELDGLLGFMQRAEQQTQAVLGRVEDLAVHFRQDTAQLGLVTRAIEDEVMAVRLLPVATIFGPYERMVRDLTHDSGKQARLILEGGDTEIDRKILEQLRDPLMHMLRNAVDHGIEPSSTRQARGKPPVGTIQVTAAQRGGVIEIDLRDDGAGLDPVRLRASAVKKGLLTDEQAAALDDAAAIDLIFRPGFSTAGAVTEVSGRGVGMDVVREHLERLNGAVEVESTPGEGTRFTIRVPLTLATSRTLLVQQGEQRFAIPSATIERTGRVKESALLSLEGRRAVTIEGHPVAAVELASVLERTATRSDAPDPEDWHDYLVLRQGDRRVALLVDELVGEQGVVVKSLGWPLRRVRNVGGATVLGSGEVVVILNPTDLLKTAARLQQTGGPTTATVVQTERKRHRLLVVDDSLTTRALIGSILEAAGYDVAVAMDGVEALAVLRERPTDLVVTDVEMPRLDGFDLTAEIRRDEHLRQTPVILVTSLGSPEHQERGVAIGADAYIVKSGFDQAQLLEAIRRLL